MQMRLLDATDYRVTSPLGADPQARRCWFVRGAQVICLLKGNQIQFLGNLFIPKDFS